MRCYGPKTTAYLRLTPSGLLPALELDGRFFTESAAIMDLLERAFPDNKPLVPDAAASPAAAPTSSRRSPSSRTPWLRPLPQEARKRAREEAAAT